MANTMTFCFRLNTEACLQNEINCSAGKRPYSNKRKRSCCLVNVPPTFPSCLHYSGQTVILPTGRVWNPGVLSGDARYQLPIMPLARSFWCMLASMNLPKNIPVGNADAGRYFSTDVLTAPIMYVLTYNYTMIALTLPVLLPPDISPPTAVLRLPISMTSCSCSKSRQSTPTTHSRYPHIQCSASACPKTPGNPFILQVGRWDRQTSWGRHWTPQCWVQLKTLMMHSRCVYCYRTNGQ